jgi:hypothetical protein
VKVHPDIYCHGRLLLLTQLFNRESNNSRQEMPASYHQASRPPEVC